MTIDINYVDEGRGVIMRICDEVNGKEVIDAQNKIYQQDKVSNLEYQIIDKSWCSEYNVTAEDIIEISTIFQKISKINSNLFIAIVESSMLQFSLTEVCQAHIADYVGDSKSFLNQNEALIWIREKLYKYSTNMSALE